MTSHPPTETGPAPGLPCLPPELCSALRATLDAHPLLRSTPEGPVIGHLIDYTPPTDYPDLATNMNVELAEHFPLLYQSISSALFAAGRRPVYPARFSLPAILPAGPISTKLPATWLCLASGLLTFSAPAGPCVQFHIVPRSNLDAIFS